MHFRVYAVWCLIVGQSTSDFSLTSPLKPRNARLAWKLEMQWQYCKLHSPQNSKLGFNNYKVKRKENAKYEFSNASTTLINQNFSLCMAGDYIKKYRRTGICPNFIIFLSYTELHHVFLYTVLLAKFFQVIQITEIFLISVYFLKHMKFVSRQKLYY